MNKRSASAGQALLVFRWGTSLMPSSLMKPPPATVAVADPRNVTSHNIGKVIGSACEARFAFLSPNHQATYLQRHQLAKNAATLKDLVSPQVSGTSFDRLLSFVTMGS